MKLKVEGILECAELLIVALPDKREHHIFGRRTLPEMDIASTACAIQNMWLAARAEGLGMGWVSLFDPEKLSTLLKMISCSGKKNLLFACFLFFLWYSDLLFSFIPNIGNITYTIIKKSF